MTIEITIYGKPMAKERPRMTKTGHTYTPTKTLKYEKNVKDVFLKKYKDFEIYQGKMKATIKAVFEVPKSYSKKKKNMLLETSNNYKHKPDCDNIAKIVLDSLNGLAYKDDSQITILEVIKEYGEQSKVIVKLESLEN